VKGGKKPDPVKKITRKLPPKSLVQKKNILGRENGSGKARRIVRVGKKKSPIQIGED